MPSERLLIDMTWKRKYVFVAVLGMLPVAFCGYLLFVWLWLVHSHAEDLRAAHRDLRAGMSVEQVTQTIGREARLKFDGPQIADDLTTYDASRCAFTLAYTNPYHLDPAVYCYFDANDELITAHCYE